MRMSTKIFCPYWTLKIDIQMRNIVVDEDTGGIRVWNFEEFQIKRTKSQGIEDDTVPFAATCRRLWHKRTLIRCAQGVSRTFARIEGQALFFDRVD